MKAYNIIIAAITVFLAASCKVNDIALYDEEPRIEFAEGVQCSFDDEDYLNAYILGTESYKDAEFHAQLIGYFLDSPRTFRVMSSPVENALFTPELEFENPYDFPAGVATVAAPFRVKCPAKQDVSTVNTTRTGQVDIVYDNSSEDQQFGQGRVENLACRVNVSLQIYPSDWNSQFWGAYSTAKYFLIMETFGKVHGDIEQTTDTKLEIRAAYNAYKAEYGALYGDDNDSDTEIVFPN